MFNPSPRPLRELLVFVAAFVAVFAALIVGVYLIDEAAIELDDMRRPDVLIFAFFTIIVFIPACWAAVRWAGKRPFASLISAEARFRWNVALRPLPIICVVFLAGNAAFLAFEHSGSASFDATSLLLLAIVIAFVPLQAAAEELVFRGLLPQVIGAWVKNPVVVYGVPSALFIAGHTYDWVGLIDIAVFAVCMSFIAHRTRGIEIPIVLHVLNNLCAFGLGAIGVQDMNQDSYSLAAVTVSCATTIAVTAIICADEKLMAMCAKEPEYAESAPHQRGEERERDARSVVSARPVKPQRDGRRPGPVLEQEQTEKEQTEQGRQLVRSQR